MNELFHELEADLRAERSQQKWQRFGKQMVWASVAVVAGTAAGVLWRNWQESNHMQQTNLIISGNEQLDAQHYDDAIASYDKVKADLSSAHYTLAMIRKADAQAQKGDKDGAQSTLKNIADNARGEDTKIFADIAKMKLASADVKFDKDAPLALSLSEMKGWKLYEAGKKEEAIAEFAAIYNNIDAPASMRERATLMLQYIAPEKLETVKAGNE